MWWRCAFEVALEVCLVGKPQLVGTSAKPAPCLSSFLALFSSPVDLEGMGRLPKDLFELAHQLVAIPATGLLQLRCALCGRALTLDTARG